MIKIGAFREAGCLVPLRFFENNTDDVLEYLCSLARANRGWYGDLSQASQEECQSWNRVDLIARCIRVIENEGEIEVGGKSYDTLVFGLPGIMEILDEAECSHLLEVESDDGFKLKIKLEYLA